MNVIKISPAEQSGADFQGCSVNILALITPGLVCVSLLHCEDGEKVCYGWNVEFDLEESGQCFLFQAHCVTFTVKFVFRVQAKY